MDRDYPKLIPLGNKWKLVEDFRFYINDFLMIIPKGFETDLASVPRVFWSIFPPFGEYTSAAIVHDYLYSKYNNLAINRTLADKIFLYAMKKFGVDWITRTSMYMAVRVGGSGAWQDKLENEGYKDKAFIDKSEEANQYYAGMREILGRL